jgi:hypothetical protein
MLDTCSSLSQTKCSLVRGSRKCRFRPRGHSSANVVSAVRVYGSRTAVRSSPSACVCLAAPRTLTKGKLVRTLQRRANNVCFQPLTIDAGRSHVRFRGIRADIDEPLRTDTAPSHRQSGGGCRVVNYVLRIRPGGIQLLHRGFELTVRR